MSNGYPDNDPACIDYTVSPGIAPPFAPVIASYWPGVKEEMLTPDYAGVRPKLGRAGQANADFRIDGFSSRPAGLGEPVRNRDRQG
jgi:hypothetical protein